MSHGEIRTPIAVKSLNSLDLEDGIDMVACPSPATKLHRKINDLRILPPSELLAKVAVANP
jgi:hypothetical protein